MAREKTFNICSSNPIWWQHNYIHHLHVCIIDAQQAAPDHVFNDSRETWSSLAVSFEFAGEALDAKGRAALRLAPASDGCRPECHFPVVSGRRLLTWLERREHFRHRLVVAPLGRSKHHLLAYNYISKLLFHSVRSMINMMINTLTQ